MQIVIPMSGFGERFRRAGYDVPKPLIIVDGKPIIAHVVNMFPGETDIVFICNEQHLLEPRFRMEEILREIAPTARIAPVPALREGPIGAVLAARDFISTTEPVIVNYCDFTCYWNYRDFVSFVLETGCVGAVPAYCGFHPHSLGSTFYAYMRHDNLWMRDIQEKQPFTQTPMEEFASSGTYYFRSGELCLDLFQEVRDRRLLVNDEYYASMAYKVLAERGEPIAIYELQHFMQWGTPQDLEEYKRWSAIFRRLSAGGGARPRQAGSIVLPMAGYGKRFSDAGYALPKPLVPVSGRAMAVQAIYDLPEAPAVRCIVRADMPGLQQIVSELAAAVAGLSVLRLQEGTDGQATTTRLGMEGLAPDDPVTIGACDNGMLYDSRSFETALVSGCDVLAWVIRGHADGRRRPQMFGWVDATPEGRVTGVRVKQVPEDPATDPLIVGAFTFRRALDFIRCFDRLRARDGRVNGEFYVDSMLADAVELGLDVRLFEIDGYLGWGTPDDLRTFEYWQSCFHKWDSHPYRLENDARVPGGAVAGLVTRYAPLSPGRPPNGSERPVAPAPA